MSQGSDWVSSEVVDLDHLLCFLHRQGQIAAQLTGQETEAGKRGTLGLKATGEQLAAHLVSSLLVTPCSTIFHWAAIFQAPTECQAWR